MGGKSKSTSTSASGSAQQWAQPYATSGANNVQSVFNDNQPGLQELTQLSRERITNPLVNDFGLTRSANNDARSYFQGVANGNYMNGNPYLGNMLNQSRRDVANDVNSQFEMSGRYGSDAHGYGLARGMSDAENGLLYKNYSDEMARRDQAAAALQQGGNADIASLLSSIGATAQLPYTGSANMANSLGALFNGGTSSSKQVGPSPIWGALGAGLGAAGQIFAGKG